MKPDPTVILRKNPDTKWWHWFCTDCRSWSLWKEWAHSMSHADIHARRDCHRGEVRPLPHEQTA